ncbi:MAG: dihydroorotase family protein [Euryarchaeota archaeon]|nr:dihydroorotase family protein [Euryarchaeota archaeon]MBU4608612.1 dihydroorotase family protein [Euryarchaeota archaeon]MBV1729997.1 dihydroorotase family protein [Methanobacterium sp.]MBV1754464.1 dihydroorotase family protein [Methanobacterium sp.]
MYDLCLKDCKIHPHKGLYNVGIEQGKIMTLKKTPLVADEVIDIKGKLVLPGLIDVHVHFRDPGLTYKEDFKSGSQAAAHGGFTTIMDMPNTIPPTNTACLFKEKKEIASKKCMVDFALHAGVDDLAEVEKIAPLKPASFKLFMDLCSDDFLDHIFEKVSSLDSKIPLTLHGENQKVVNDCTKKLQDENKNEAFDYSLARPPKAEELAVAQALNLSRKFQQKIHICHVSTSRALKLIDSKKREGLPVSSEITPHHLLLDSSAFKNWGNLTKTNPPLRSKEEGISFSMLDKIDLIATDHAPHTLEEKEKNVWEAAPGIPNLETVLPLLLTQMNKNNLNLDQIKSLLCENPSKIFNLENKGFIKEGMDADLVVVDLKLEGKINPDNFYTKADYTPFSGWEYKGAPVMTLSRGNVIMEEGQVMENRGRYVYLD